MTFDQPHDTVDDVEPLCSACGGDCNDSCAGAGGVAPAVAAPGGPPAPGASGVGPGIFSDDECDLEGEF